MSGALIFHFKVIFKLCINFVVFCCWDTVYCFCLIISIKKCYYLKWNKSGFVFGFIFQLCLPPMLQLFGFRVLYHKSWIKFPFLGYFGEEELLLTVLNVFYNVIQSLIVIHQLEYTESPNPLGSAYCLWGEELSSTLEEFKSCLNWFTVSTFINLKRLFLF